MAKELPDYLTRMPTLVGDAVLHCKACGGEGRAVGAVDHHKDCPEVDA